MYSDEILQYSRTNEPDIQYHSHVTCDPPPVDDGHLSLPLERGTGDVVSKLCVLVCGPHVTCVQQDIQALATMMAKISSLKGR